MMNPVRGPWVLSLGLHLVGVLLVVFWTNQAVPELPVVRMRLLGTPGTPGAGTPAEVSRWKGAQGAEVPSSEPEAPAWRETGLTEAPVALAPAVPFSLEEILAGVAPVPVPAPQVGPSEGWSGSGGEGYALPPLPPPQLAPPQGAQWSLVLRVAGSGGYALVEGLDSGHPDLDRWLEAYLRTLVFPPSFDGQDYQLRWDLRLASGRPE